MRGDVLEEHSVSLGVHLVLWRLCFSVQQTQEELFAPGSQCISFSPLFSSAFPFPSFASAFLGVRQPRVQRWHRVSSGEMLN